MMTGSASRRLRGVPERAARVLVVEDERDVAELLRYNLAKESFEVTGRAEEATRSSASSSARTTT
jgi:DNA-binding response OmpR family regulator